jgi:hypothetical protein
MAAHHLADIISIGLDVLKTSLSKATNLITAQLGDVVSSEALSDDASWWQHVGFASRPRKPTPGKSSAQVVVVTRSDHDAVIASRDARAAAIYGQLDDGETAVFASVDGGAIIVFDKNGGATLTSGDIKLGDSDAKAVADGAAFEALWNQMSACAATLDAAATFAGSPNVPPLATFFTNHALDKLKTTKGKIT